MTNAVVTINGSRTALPTVLGQGPARLPTGGKIRAGIKVLTKRAAENPHAQEIYEQGMAAGQSFEQIEQRLGEALPSLKSPLVPKNVPWFTVRAQDFPNPEVAAQILDTYGEARGDGVKRLYRFPVIFPSDLWQVVMPHELVAWGANDKKFWSEYAPDGHARYCKCYAPVPRDSTGKRAIRMFGGRKTALRSDNGGLCDPENCDEYQQRQCNLSGRFIFFIPGIRSISAFELPTNSFYAMNAAIRKFETIAFLRGGRLSGFLDAQQTSFYLTKKRMEVAHIDETGRAVRVPQWIIELEAPVDIAALLRANDDEETAIANAGAASRVLEGAASEGAASPAPEPVDLPVAWSDNGNGMASGKGGKSVADACPVGCAPDRGGSIGPSFAQVMATARAYGIDAARYETYADRRWGSGWKINAGGRRKALEELDRYCNDPRGYADKIDAALNAAGDAAGETRP